MILATCLTLMYSCRKEHSVVQPKNYIQEIQNSLKDSITEPIYESLEFSKAILSRVDSLNLFMLRIPFKGKKLENDFIVLHTGITGNILKGKIIHLEGTATEAYEEKDESKSWNGNIRISSLDEKSVLRSAIINGNITAFNRMSDARTTSMSSDLPEVIITYVIKSPKSAWSSYIDIHSLFYDNPLGFSNNSLYYSTGGGGSGSGSSGSGVSSGGSTGFGGIESEDPIKIDFETQDDLVAIDLQKFINCFNSIPDAGATCSIQIFTDIPVDSDPNLIFDFKSGSPGHTFINIRKSNGSQGASQNIGFYPVNGYKAGLTNAPIDGKFVDNGNHEFNAGFKMELTPAELKSVLTELLYLRNIKYDIDNYNCTDWAMAVFNKVRTDKLVIPLYDIPGNYPSLGTSTPQGVFNRLKQMKTSGHPEAANINVDFLKGWAGNSTGPCN